MGVTVVLFVSVVLDGAVIAVAWIIVSFRASVATGVAASSPVGVSGVIFVVVVVQIAWNTTNAL